MRRSTGVGIVVVALVLTVGGCGGGGTHENGGTAAAEATPGRSADPAGPLPEAADGRDYGACSDGACQVLVTSTADITANGTDVHVTVDGSVTFRTPGTLTNLGGQGSVAQFGSGLKVKVVAQHGKGAVLEFAVP
ncbi:hypothetical protein ABZ016_10005 [Streptomyces sp. NPDC006372]|uniref:hypothetical protein n=1 Tax=Streptomyces sp. NPDC006372 TaxID=3155599 RepID=UPI0033B81E50